MTELCPPQDTAYMHTKMIEKRRGASPQSTCRGKGNPGPEKPKTVTTKSVTWRCLEIARFGALSGVPFETPPLLPALVFLPRLFG